MPVNVIPDSKPAGITSDKLVKYLLAINLIEYEADIRGVLDSFAADPADPQIKDVVIATVAVIMTLGGMKWTVASRVASTLSKRTPEQLQNDAVAQINGTHIVLPIGTSDDVVVLDLANMRPTSEPPMAFVSTIYSVSTIWKRAAQLLA